MADTRRLGVEEPAGAREQMAVEHRHARQHLGDEGLFLGDEPQQRDVSAVVEVDLVGHA